MGSKPALVNATRAFLVGEQELPLPGPQTVVEVVEDLGRGPEAPLASSWWPRRPRRAGS